MGRGSSTKRIGEILLENKLISAAQLETALRQQRESLEPKRLGEILVENGVLTLDVFIEYLRMQTDGSSKR